MDLTTIQRIAAENPGLVAIITIVLAAGVLVLADEYRRARQFANEQDPAKLRERVRERINREIEAAQRAHDR